MWKAAAGAQVNLTNLDNTDDDWETDPDFVNDVTEQEQRWGSSTIAGSGRTGGAIDMEKLRKETEESDALKKKKDLDDGPKASFGYGGKFGVQQDRMDKSAQGHDYIGKVEKHASQKDYSTGFGGKYGVQTDRVDKSAVSWDHKEKIQKHSSQSDYTTGFGGKFGVQSDRQDRSAVGWDHVEKLQKHESQKDYSKGFGGKFGVQSDRQDKSAVGWDHHEAPQKHNSQTDHKIGFGGKFGVQTDRMDKSAVAFGEEPNRVGTNYIKTKPDIGSAKPGELRTKFEKMGEVEGAAVTSTSHLHTPKQLDQSKVAFLKQESLVSSEVKMAPGHLDQSKLSQFTDVASEIPVSNSNQVKEELEQLRKAQQQEKPVEEENIYENQANNAAITETVINETTEETVVPHVTQQDEIVDTGLTAVALYDYQAGAEDEISFDPDDVITHVEKIDEGWWRGMCKGHYGLFPANYVQLQS